MTVYRQKINELLKKNYFWDIDITQDKPVSERLVVERICSFGTLSELALLIRLLGRDKVADILTGLNYLDPKTLNFMSKFFGRPKRDFKCYTRRQLTIQHWDY
jgi:hypothetical protein